MTRETLIPLASLLGGLLACVLCVATAVSLRFLREVQRDHPALHAELGRPSRFYFLAFAWITPSKYGLWLLAPPDSAQGLPAALRRDAALLRRLLLAAFALSLAAAVLSAASWFA